MPRRNLHLIRDRNPNHHGRKQHLHVPPYCGNHLRRCAWTQTARTRGPQHRNHRNPNHIHLPSPERTPPPPNNGKVLLPLALAHRGVYSGRSVHSHVHPKEKVRQNARNPQGSVTRNPVLIAILFFIALRRHLVMFATSTFGVGGGFWATFGVSDSSAQ